MNIDLERGLEIIRNLSIEEVGGVVAALILIGLAKILGQGGWKVIKFTSVGTYRGVRYTYRNPKKTAKQVAGGTVVSTVLLVMISLSTAMASVVVAFYVWLFGNPEFATGDFTRPFYDSLWLSGACVTFGAVSNIIVMYCRGKFGSRSQPNAGDEHQENVNSLTALFRALPRLEQSAVGNIQHCHGNIVGVVDGWYYSLKDVYNDGFTQHNAAIESFKSRIADQFQSLAFNGKIKNCDWVHQNGDFYTKYEYTTTDGVTGQTEDLWEAYSKASA